mmetsp:Transcript_21415/g.43815  ORF Transcript_21415/g.43815 Transcript_21415/m.43815 type:complete len:136 (-) Transcript_21415:155-562(-)
MVKNYSLSQRRKTAKSQIENTDGNQQTGNTSLIDFPAHSAMELRKMSSTSPTPAPYTNDLAADELNKEAISHSSIDATPKRLGWTKKMWLITPLLILLISSMVCLSIGSNVVSSREIHVLVAQHVLSSVESLFMR